ncbi:MAG: ABC-type transport auxiliary lipoprotein family protein [Sphingomonas sp.]
MPSAPFKTALALAALVPLSACISFGAKPPASLLTLTSVSAIPPGQTQSSASSPTIQILVPAVGQALASQRVPVQENDTAIAYVKNALWVEPPARLFARLLSDTIAAKTGRVVLSTAQSFADPGARLSGELRAFGVDAGGNQAVVIYDAALIRSSSNVVEKRRFEARAPVGAVETNAVGAGINTAANQVASEVAEWVGR